MGGGGSTQDCLDDSSVTPSAVSMHESRDLNLIWGPGNEEKTDIWTKQEWGVGSGLSAGETAALQKLSVFVI